MKTRPKKFIRSIGVWLPLVLFVIFSWNPSTVLSGTTSLKSDGSSSVVHRDVDRLKILSVLENKMGSQKSLERVKIKLFKLSDERTRLIASLSELVANEGNRAGADVAFLLLTALIVLS